VDCVFSTITKALKKKDTVTLIGFGIFKVQKRKARKGRHPQTGAVITISAKKVPRFVPGKALKDAVS
jgi:DNA-binding protein HU-beta